MHLCIEVKSCDPFRILYRLDRIKLGSICLVHTLSNTLITWYLDSGMSNRETLQKEQYRTSW